MVCVLEQVVNWKVYVHGYCNTKDVFLFFFLIASQKHVKNARVIPLNPETQLRSHQKGINGQTFPVPQESLAILLTAQNQKSWCELWLNWPLFIYCWRGWYTQAAWPRKLQKWPSSYIWYHCSSDLIIKDVCMFQFYIYKKKTQNLGVFFVPKAFSFI